MRGTGEARLLHGGLLRTWLSGCSNARVSVRRGHPLFARLYARVSPCMDRGGLSDSRHRLMVGLSGRVIEIGSGNGLNFASYPPTVTGVLAVGPEPYLRQIAREHAASAWC